MSRNIARFFHFSLETEFNALPFINYTIPRLCSTYAMATIEKNTDAISLVICGDKGGSSTKIICQFTDSEASHSVRTAKLLGIYQGGKDSRANIQTAFGPIFAQLEKLQKSFAENFTPQANDDYTVSETNDSNLDKSPKFVLTLKNENKTIKNLFELLPGCYDESNNYFSGQCENCMNHFRRHNWTGTHDTSFSVCFGSDLMWLSYIFRLTGPNGKYFCNNCLASQQDVAKGIPHSPVILPKYRTTDSN